MSSTIEETQDLLNGGTMDNQEFPFMSRPLDKVSNVTDTLWEHAKQKHNAPLKRSLANYSGLI